MPNALPLSGRVALVTGVSRRAGIGFAITRRLLADGARVFATGWESHDDEMPWGRDPDGIRFVLGELGGSGDSLDYVAADLEQPEAAAELVDRTVARFGRIDILIANHARSSHQHFKDVTVEELDRCWAINARGSLLLARALSEQRPQGSGGRVVLFTSGQHIAPMPDEIAYALSKGTLHQMTRTLADALADHGITVNCINPGPVDTGWATDAVRAAVAATVPAVRWGQPDDVAKLVSWLVSDEAEPVTGQVHDMGRDTDPLRSGADSPT